MHRFLLLAMLVLFPNVALAHTMSTSGFTSGLWHPVLGLDHLLAMVSVGIVSTQLGGRAIWTVPASFVLIMALGGYAGMQSFDFLPIESIVVLIEQGITLSVILLGLAIALDKKISIAIAMLVCGFFGFFHGFAHGTEIPDVALSATYIAGFMVGTALLHIVGVGLGEIARRVPNGSTVLRYVGAVVMGMGLHIEYQMLSTSGWGL